MQKNKTLTPSTILNLRMKKFELDNGYTCKQKEYKQAKSVSVKAI